MGYQKRMSAPPAWPIPRKDHTLAVSPSPGPHPAGASLSLAMVVRDLLRLVDLSREAKRLIAEGAIHVNGKAVRDYKFPCGFFDIVTVPSTGLHRCIVPDRHGRLTLREVTPEQAKSKLTRVEDRHTLPGRRVQLNLHEGWNLLAPPEASAAKPGDSLVLSLPDKKVLRHIPRQPGAHALIVGGAQSGTLGTIESLVEMKGSGPNTIRLQAGGRRVETIADYVVAIGPEEEAYLTGLRPAPEAA